jgi:hypothetical protein
MQDSDYVPARSAGNEPMVKDAPTCISTDGEDALRRILAAIEAETIGAVGFVGGFLEGLGEHITGLIANGPSDLPAGT